MTYSARLRALRIDAPIPATAHFAVKEGFLFMDHHIGQGRPSCA